MQEQIVKIFPRQNFAVATSHAFESPAGSRAIELQELALAQSAAWRRWWILYSEPDMWEVPAKRREMCAARLAYHDASIALESAMRDQERE
jgi:hypothetical protein